MGMVYAPGTTETTKNAERRAADQWTNYNVYFLTRFYSTRYFAKLLRFVFRAKLRSAYNVPSIACHY